MSERVTKYPRRLIEVDLPIGRISAHARQEKSIRQGHISTLHIWWARRPLAACRAVILASLWPDPAEEEGYPPCPALFVTAARERMLWWAEHSLKKASAESAERIVSVQKNPKLLSDGFELRGALLDFIADFADWQNATDKEYLETARLLTHAAHLALGGESTTRPLVVDPFAGGGSIPLEALRVGADAYATDLNPVAVLLNKVVLEYIPQYGQRLAKDVRLWGQWVKEQAEEELRRYYPQEEDGSTPIAYLWARTILCDGPSCGITVPLVRSLWLAKKPGKSIGMKMIADNSTKGMRFEIVHGVRSIASGTIARGSATCPLCGYTTKVERVRAQLSVRRGGSNDAQLLAVVTVTKGRSGRNYRAVANGDLEVAQAAGEALRELEKQYTGTLSLIPDEKISLNEIRRISVPLYGMSHWRDLFNTRQTLFIATMVSIVRDRLATEIGLQDPGYTAAIQAILSCAIDREVENLSALCRWNSVGEKMQGTFGRQALPMMWDFCEANPFGGSVGSFDSVLECVLIPFETGEAITHAGTVELASATRHPLPDDAADAVITDPPYYDAVPYSHLSDFFYVWLRRVLPLPIRSIFEMSQTPKEAEIVVDRPHALSTSKKGVKFYEAELRKAFTEARRILKPHGICVIVFASKTTSSWEAILQGCLDAGWTITGSWPIDTEMGTRMNAMGTASLASSVHLVCRPREHQGRLAYADHLGDWRDVQTELPERIRTWMLRLASEGIVGADAIFACLGPALEIFSRYSRVERSDGTHVKLKEYLELVWSAVSHEALSMIFKDVDATSLEAEARLTAMWLWTVSGSKATATLSGDDHDDDGAADDDGEPGGKKGKATGWVLEFDAARKIAMGLGIDLEKSHSIVEVKGETARLLPVAERASVLFAKSKQPAQAPVALRKARQLNLIAPESGEDQGSDRFGDLTSHAEVTTVLDRLHQAMILFAARRSEAMKRLIVDDGVGNDPRFWKLAQHLSALYPQGSEERRWVEGVAAKKKGLGF